MDFAPVLRELVEHPKCAGVTFWPTSEGRFMVSVAYESRATMIVMYDANPLRALWLARQEFFSRLAPVAKEGLF